MITISKVGSPVAISKIGAPSLNIAVNELSFDDPSKSLDRKTKDDCIQIPKYTKSDGTVVEAHERCIERVIEGETPRQKRRDEKLHEFEGLEKFKDLRIAQSFKELETHIDGSNFSDGFRNSLRDVAEGEVIFTTGDREFPFEKIPNLSDTQNAIVNMYSSTLSQMNEQIIEGQLTRAGAFYVEALNQALEDSPRLEPNELVYRGIRVNELSEKDLKQYTDNINGDLVNFESFASSTREENLFFAMRGKDRVVYDIFTTDNSRAVDIAGISSYDENEVLFPTDSKFHILGTTFDDENETARIVLKEYNGEGGAEREYESAILSEGWKVFTEDSILEFKSPNENIKSFYDNGEYVLLTGDVEERFSSLTELLAKINS